MTGQSALPHKKSAHCRPLCRSRGDGRGRMVLTAFVACCFASCAHCTLPSAFPYCLPAGKRKANRGGRGGGSSGRGGPSSPEGLSSRERVLKKMKIT